MLNNKSQLFFQINDHGVLYVPKRKVSMSYHDDSLHKTNAWWKPLVALCI